MDSVLPSESGTARGRRRSTSSIRESLRELSVQLSLLNHQVSAHLALNDVDIDCLDLINRHGPLSPSALSRRAGLHPATLTGVLDRLQKGGWIARERDTTDRRAVMLRAIRERNGELLHLYSGMNTAMEQLCAEYSDAELELLAGFLQHTADAGRDATEQLARTD